MRFWQKIFLISLAVLTVAVNTIAYLLIGNNHQLNKEKEIKSSVDEYSIVVSSFQTNVLYERYRSSEAELDDTQITQIAREFSSLFTLIICTYSSTRARNGYSLTLPGICRTIYTRM